MAIDPASPKPRSGWITRHESGRRWVREVKVWPGYFCAVTFIPQKGGWYWSAHHTGGGYMGGSGVAESGEAAMDEAERVMAAGIRVEDASA